MGNNYKAPYWQPPLTGVEVKEKLVAPDWPPTPVKMEDGKLYITKGSTYDTDNVANQWKAATVGQSTPVWIMHSDIKLQQCGSPPPPGGDYPGLNPLRHATG